MKSMDKYVGPPQINDNSTLKISEIESNRYNSIIPTSKLIMGLILVILTF